MNCLEFCQTICPYSGQWYPTPTFTYWSIVVLFRISHSRAYVNNEVIWTLVEIKKSVQNAILTMFHSILPWIETSLIITELFKQKETVEAPWSSVANILNYYVVTELNQKSENGTQVSTILSINTAIVHQSETVNSI